MSLIISSHPLTNHYLSALRDKNTAPDTYRRTANRLGQILVVEATKNLPLKTYPLSTPIQDTQGECLAEPVTVVPVLRAGLGLLQAAQDIIPNVQVGFIGLQRDETTAEPNAYYSKFPKLSEGTVLVLEPMLATGGSLSWACDQIKLAGATNITAVCVLVATPGVERIDRDHPDVKIVAAGCDDTLDDNYFIVPGLGDMGDRLFGTI